MPAVQLLIYGKVQGVFYRASAQKIARRLSLTGWIKNTEDGNVEALVCGTAEAILEFVAWCRHGPSGAEVTDVAVSKKEEGAFTDFKIVH